MALHSEQKIIEIMQKKIRGGHRSSFEARMRLSVIDRAFHGYKDLDDELLKYFPVAAVASMESFFRSAVAEAIDKGEPYLTNANGIMKAIKFDIDIVKAFQGKNITLGELVAHQLPFSSIDHLGSVLSEILEINFLAELKSIHKRWDYEVEGLPKVPIIEDISKVFSDVQKLFTARHIICHELGGGLELNRSLMSGYLISVSTFLDASYELLSNSLYPNSPLTQADMNLDAGKLLHGSLEQLEEIKKQILQKLVGKRKEEFLKVENFWCAYYKGWAEFEANEYEGGSIWPTIYASEANTLVCDRIEELDAYLKSLSS